MIIPVRIPKSAPISTVGGERTLAADHPLFATDCPVCGGPLLDHPITLVVVGMDPEFAIFDTFVDMLTVWDATAEEIEELFVEEEIRLTRERVRRKLQHVRAGEPRRAYFQFALSWEEALEMDRERDGEASREKGGAPT